MIGQKRLDTNYKIDLTEWQINQDNEIDTLHNSVVDIDNRVKELEKGNDCDKKLLGEYDTRFKHLAIGCIVNIILWLLVIILSL